MSGGPPCQGYSLLNSFSEREYSQFKNSLVATYLSYADFYRPKYFIMENVKNFASYKKSLVLKLCLRALVRMGYQCTFGILQAGNYGVPQHRHRCFVMAVGPDQMLPDFPEPKHVFSRKRSKLSLLVDERLYCNGTTRIEVAPYRTVTVRDAMSDLPAIDSGADRCLLPTVQGYLQREAGELSPFQRKMRRRKEEVEVEQRNRSSSEVQETLDHVVKEVGLLMQARISEIPVDIPGADWRNLPNKVVALKDGSSTRLLEYRYDSSGGAKKGVCPCQDIAASRKRRRSGGAAHRTVCDPMDNQSFTLVRDFWTIA